MTHARASQMPGRLASQLSRLAFVALTTGAAAAHAALIDRGNGLIYDTVLDITWVQNASLCVTLDNCVNRDDTLVTGGMSWHDARTWAANLVYQGFNDWRLPHASVAAAGAATDEIVLCFAATEAECRDNEMGYMFYHHLAGTLLEDKTGVQTSVGGVTFTGIQSLYWSATQPVLFDPLPPPPPPPPPPFLGIAAADTAWFFRFDVGAPGLFSISDPLAAWAVRDGDVLPAAVSEPPGVLLAALGLTLALLRLYTRPLRRSSATRTPGS